MSNKKDISTLLKLLVNLKFFSKKKASSFDYKSIDAIVKKKREIETRMHKATLNIATVKYVKELMDSGEHNYSENELDKIISDLKEEANKL